MAVGLTEGPPGPERAADTPASSSTSGVSAVSTAPTLLPPPPPSSPSPSPSSWGHQGQSEKEKKAIHQRVFEPSVGGWWLTPPEMPSRSGSASWSRVPISSGSSPSSARCNRSARQQPGAEMPCCWQKMQPARVQSRVADSLTPDRLANTCGSSCRMPDRSGGSRLPCNRGTERRAPAHKFLCNQSGGRGSNAVDGAAPVQRWLLPSPTPHFHHFSYRISSNVKSSPV